MARTDTAAPPALFSIHDVTPDNLDRVERLVELVREGGHGPPLLLVVAGEPWAEAESDSSRGTSGAGSDGAGAMCRYPPTTNVRPSSETLDRLRALVDGGCALAGHGWSHRAPPARSLGHRLHSAFLSRDRGEHLSRSRDEVRGIVRRSFDWFGRHGFEPPAVYTPPAWALGRLNRQDLAELPFRYYETLAGYVDSAVEPGGRLLPLPLVGFEADNGFRRWALKISNGLNVALGRSLRWPVRIGLHPTDLDLLLEDEARALVARRWTPVSVEEAFAG